MGDHVKGDLIPINTDRLCLLAITHEVGSDIHRCPTLVDDRRQIAEVATATGVLDQDDRRIVHPIAVEIAEGVDLRVQHDRRA